MKNFEKQSEIARAKVSAILEKMNALGEKARKLQDSGVIEEEIEFIKFGFVRAILKKPISIKIKWRDNYENGCLYEASTKEHALWGSGDSVAKAKTELNKEFWHYFGDCMNIPDSDSDRNSSRIKKELIRAIKKIVVTSPVIYYKQGEDWIAKDLYFDFTCRGKTSKSALSGLEEEVKKAIKQAKKLKNGYPYIASCNVFDMEELVKRLECISQQNLEAHILFVEREVRNA